MNAIEITDVTKRFGATAVLRGVTLALPEHSLTAILGASGSGKTTLLRLVAGFERLDGGSIAIGGRVVDDGRTVVRSQHRGVGFVPQDAALFPHLTAVKNVGFGLARAERGRASELLALVGLGGLEHRYPHQLSGGQQQRVALARALAIRPAVVLLDEPFSSLDASLRGDVRRDVARILTETGTTTLLVTHDQDEALAMADQVALLADGEILACTTPKRLYENPPGLAAARSVGEANVLDAHAEHSSAMCVLGSIPVRGNGHLMPDGPCRLLLRPEQLVLSADDSDGGIRADVVELQYHGHEAMAWVRISTAAEAPPLLARVPGGQALVPGQSVWVAVSGLASAWPA